MKPRKPTFIIMGGLSCGVALGWAVGSIQEKSPQTPSRGRTASVENQNAQAILGLGKAGAPKNPAAGPAAGSRSAESHPHLSPQSPDFIKTIRQTLEISDSIDRAVQLRDLLRSIPIEEIPAAFVKAKKMQRGESWEVLSALGARWAEVDPHAAVAFGLRAGSSGPWGGFNSFLNGAVDEWLNTSPAEAIAWVEALPPGSGRSNQIEEMISFLGDTDPQQALQLLQKNALAMSGRSTTESIFTDWAGRDPEGAAAAALQLKGDIGLGALRAVARSWAQDDPTKAMAWASSVPNRSARKDLITSIAEQWSQSDPRAEITWALGLSDPDLRRETLSTGIAKLAANDLPAALEQIHAMPSGEDHDRALLAAANTAAAKDAHGALRLLDELPAGPNRSSAAAKLCDTWSQTDPRGALDWLVQNVPSAKSNGLSMGSSFGRNYYYNSPGLASIITRWAGSSPQDAIAWAQALPDGDNRNSAMAAVVQSLAPTDFSHAESIFNQLPPDAQQMAASTLTNNLLQQDTGKARAWVESLPEGPAQNNGLMAVARQWANESPTAAADWLGTLAPGQGRDNAISGYSSAVFQTDPEGALSWVTTIADAKDRDQQTERYVSWWMRTDSTAARNWLQANQQISPEEKDRILNN